MLELFPSKHVRLHETLLGLGAAVLAELWDPKDVDSVWELLKDLKRRKKTVPDHTTFEDMILAVEFLFALGAVSTNSKGELVRCA